MAGRSFFGLDGSVQACYTLFILRILGGLDVVGIVMA